MNSWNRCKYPEIADENLRKAVTYACDYLRETGWFNKAVEEAACEYDVDEDDIKREIRKRQSAGQKWKNAHTPSKKYHWYAIEYSMGYGGECEAEMVFRYDIAEYIVKRALTRENAENAMINWVDDIFCYLGRIEEFDSKSEAEKCALNWQREQRRQVQQEQLEEWRWRLQEQERMKKCDYIADNFAKIKTAFTRPPESVFIEITEAKCLSNGNLGIACPNPAVRDFWTVRVEKLKKAIKTVFQAELSIEIILNDSIDIALEENKKLRNKIHFDNIEIF